ncbi:acidic leucine-rich nuclear phosphoprotein 32 family member B [Manduca sexta]|uniref:acidic leucine-rich nuclear phosphoprotein 32 family member B n=1 Tax=Manduca sexta TaxID=7130 RepID=UPI00188FE3D0|nr:acidic leucine-rich nuclear phosphoprotein 32 family member B [Manduca sexta]
MGPRIALLLALTACCRCEHDTHPLGRTTRRQLVEIVPVARDGAPPAAAAPSLAYIVPAPHLDMEAEDSDIEEMTVYADLERDGELDREADEEEREAEIEANETELEARNGEERDDRKEDGAQTVKLCGGHGAGGRRAHLHPAYTLSFVFGR